MPNTRLDQRYHLVQIVQRDNLLQSLVKLSMGRFGFARQKGALGAVQFGEYAQSSGSGNANIVISDRETLAALN